MAQTSLTRWQLADDPPRSMMPLMDFKSLAQTRRSVHHFVPDFVVPRVDVEEMVRLSALSPSGYNAQPWRFVAIQNHDILQKTQALAFGQPHLTQAGTAVLVLGNTQFGEEEHARICDEWAAHREYDEKQVEDLRRSLLKDRAQPQKDQMTLRSCSLAAMSFLFAAQSLGYSTCPMMGFSRTKIKKLLGVPAHYMPVLLIALGQEDTTKTPPRLPRKTVSDLLSYDSF